MTPPNSDPKQGTLLCIGTTGMLAECTQRLLADGWKVHVIARNPEALRTHSTDVLTTAACDYHDLDAFKRALNQAPDPVVSVLYWIHSSAQDAINLLESRYAETNRLRVVGSAHQPIPNAKSSERIIKLGFVTQPNGSRWLTHQEISEGVYNAFVSGQVSSTVGTTKPWSARP
ncbi:MAG: hypothetical protein JJ974_11310 [Phycisphaerales bacterium]|nr:hypothetical protein [Phycisphaerales bacterium]